MVGVKLDEFDTVGLADGVARCEVVLPCDPDAPGDTDGELVGACEREGLSLAEADCELVVDSAAASSTPRSMT